MTLNQKRKDKMNTSTIRRRAYRPMLLLIALLAIALFCALKCHGQTNLPDSFVVTNKEQAFTALLHFMGFGPSDILLAGLVLKMLAGYWRNFALKNKVAEDVGPLSRMIAHVAADSLPSAPPVQAAPGAAIHG